MKVFLLLLSILYIIGCSPVSNNKINSKNLKISFPTIEPVFIEQESTDKPENFLKEFPENKIILDSVIYFKKKFFYKNMFNSVIDFDYDNGVLAVLKEDKIVSNIKECKSILIDKKFSTISLNNLLIGVDSKDVYKIYDLKSCGEIFSFKKNGYKVDFYKDKILTYKNRYFEILNINKSVYLSGNLFKKIIASHIYKENAYLVDADKNFVIIDLKNKKMNFVSKFQTDKVFFKNSYLFLNVDKKLIKHSLNEFKNIEEIKSENFVIKDNNLLITEPKLNKVEDLNFNNIKKLANVKDNYLILVNNKLVMINLNKKGYEKKILLNKYRPFACMDNDYILFYDINNKKIFIDLKNYKILNSINNFRCKSELKYSDGGFYDFDGKLLFKFANVINRNKNYKMLMRKIDDKNIYFYFDKLN